MTGDVYEATTPQGDPCIVKIVSAQVLATPQATAQAMSMLMMQTQLNHPNVAKVLQAGATPEGSVWYAQEKVVGANSLLDLVGKNGSLPYAKAATITSSVSEGLASALGIGIIHQDVSPKNVLIGSDGVPKLINFSVPVVACEEATGVPAFLPPEVLEGQARSPQSLVYSVGALFHFACSGGQPYNGDSKSILALAKKGEVAPIAAKSKAPTAVDDLLKKSLAANAANRHATIQELASGLSQIAKMPAPAAAAPTPGVGKATMLGIPAGDVLKAMTGPQTTPPGRAATTPPSAPPRSASQSGAAKPAYVPPGGAPRQATVPPSAPPRSASQSGAAKPAYVPPGGAPRQATIPPAVPRPSSQPAAVRQPTAPPPAAEPTEVPPTRKLTAPRADSASGKARAGTAEEQAKRGSFRETLWFKKGELDAAAQDKAAKEAERSGRIVPDRADLLPIDDRYKDDGSLSSQDKSRYSLKTGNTIAPMEPDEGEFQGQESSLIGEMKEGRKKIVVALIAGLLLLVLLIGYVASHSSNEPAEPAKDKAKVEAAPEGDKTDQTKTDTKPAEVKPK